MKLYYKVFLFENGQKTIEYTQNLSYPIFTEERLDEQLSGGEVIFNFIESELKNKFSPKTKFLIERYQASDFSDVPRVWEYVVEDCNNETFVGLNNSNCCRVSLLEPAVIAQSKHIDNIALTYELQDVDLNYKTIITEKETIGSKGFFNVEGYNKIGPIHENPPMSLGTVYFRNSFNYVWRNTESLASKKWRVDGRVPVTIEFEIPKLMCQGVVTTGGQFEDIVECETETQIIKKRYDVNKNILEEKVVLERKNGPSSLTPTANETFFITTKQTISEPGSSVVHQYAAYITKIEPFSSASRGVIVSIDGLEQFSDHFHHNSTFPTEIAVTRDEYKYSSIILFETDALTTEQLKNKEYIEYEIICKGVSSLPFYYEADCEVLEVSNPDGYRNTTGTDQNYDYGTVEKIEGSSLYITAKMRVEDLAQEVDAGPFIKKGKKYCAYDLIRKALLTCDTQVIDNNTHGLDDIEYPIFISNNDKFGEDDEYLIDKLKTTQLSETTFEQKNLWEVFVQVGYYLHAIPKLRFADDGTDRYILYYQKLGNIQKKEDTNTKITIYNSQNINEYFSQMDMYLDNFHSPQNVVEEWLVPKSNDNSFIVSNENAILKTKYPIYEIVEFKATYKGASQNLINYIFEESIYAILTSHFRDDDNSKIVPSKGVAVYYSLGDNYIQGLYYQPPSVNANESVALKNIISLAFGLSENDVSKIKYNDILFYIKYRTRDSMRLSQFRPDLNNYLKNSSYEKYPHHEQFFGPQDKILDSERFSANIFGQLVRIGNLLYQRQECVRNIKDERRAGDLVEINGEPYYVTAVESEMYPDAILQKVTYSKNFNQLSKIVTIPSEPRFYEVSERSKIRREVRLNEFLELKNAKDVNIRFNPKFLNQDKWKEIVKSLIFNENDLKLPNFVFVRFLGDRFRHSEKEYNKLFPSSDIERTVHNAVKPVDSSDHVDCIIPVLSFPLRNGLIFEWDLEDNFKVGDFIDLMVAENQDVTDKAYYGLSSLRYCDIYGRADLYKFKLFNNSNCDLLSAQMFPKTTVEPINSDCFVYLPNNKSIALDKDNREELSFNFQISLLYDNSFITFANLFGEKNGKLHCCLLNKEVGLSSENANINLKTIVVEDLIYTLIDNDEKNFIEIQFDAPTNVDLNQVKSIVFYDVDETKNKISYIVKNVANLNNEDKLQNLALSIVFNE